jgi:hypothetical protein
MPKHQPSSIDRLPEDVKEQLQALLRDPRVTQLEATARINEILEDEGHGQRLSKSAVNRYAVAMEKIGARIRQSREVAQMWVARLGAEPQGEVGKLLNEMVRNLAFDLTAQMLENEQPAEPKMLRDLAIAIERLEKAASENVKRDEEIRRQERERIAAELDKAAGRADGLLSEQAIKSIREQLGL